MGNSSDLPGPEVQGPKSVQTGTNDRVPVSLNTNSNIWGQTANKSFG